jgi:hypothetical protein
MEAGTTRLPRKSPIKSVHMVTLSADGSVQREKLAERKSRRGSKRLRPLEKAMRRMSNAQGAAADEYLSRHERSNRKKKNGWAKDFGKNMSRSSKKGMKKLKIRIF